MPGAVTPWWQSAVIYQIYPRSFADANRDGIGDLAGIRDHLDHLTDLGVDAVWLSPFYPSPMADFGYDVADYCDVDPLFGTLDDFDTLLADAHRRGIRMIIDFVPNHSSDRHPWFVESRSSRDNPKRDWYIWRDPAPNGGPPNNWRASFTGDDGWVRDDSGQLRPRWGLQVSDDADTSAWTFDDATGQYYLHTFLPQQPDLDWRNPDVVAAMHAALRFWLERGVDGFRVDAITTLGKPPGLPDVDAKLARIPHAGLTDEAFVQQAVRGIRSLLDEYPGTMMVGEVGGVDVPSIMRHVGHDRFHLAFNFPPMFDKWLAPRWRRHIDATEAHVNRAHDLWPAWVLSNHDAPRHADRFGSDARARAAAVLLLTLRGTVFLYAGEELGLVDADVPPERVVDPGGRDGCRAPVPWTPGPDHGWPADPWLPFARNADGHDVRSEADDPASMLALYGSLLALRRSSPALHAGSFAWIDSPDTVLAFRRAAADETMTVVVNTSDHHHDVALHGAHTIVASTDHREVGAPWAGTIGPDGGVVLRPA